MSNCCKNCESPLNGNFCNQCGQSANTDRLNYKFLWHEIQLGLFQFEKGILFTVKGLFTRPGISIKEFIEGKRIRHIKPFSLVVLLAGIYGFLAHYFDINILSNNFTVSGSGEKLIQTQNALSRMTNWVSQHYSIIALLQIPIFSIGTFLAFKKVNYNFIEHLVINSFIAAQKLVIRLVSFPLFLYFNNSPNLKFIARSADIFGYILTIWTLMQLFGEYNFANRALRTAVALAIAFALLLSMLTIAGMVYLG